MRCGAFRIGGAAVKASGDCLKRREASVAVLEAAKSVCLRELIRPSPGRRIRKGFGGTVAVVR